MSKKQSQDLSKNMPKPPKKQAVRAEDLPPLWRPTWEWHGRALLIIYAVVIVLFFIVRAWLKPYVRQLPADITPWMHQNKAPDALTR